MEEIEVIVEYDYAAQETDELTLKKGDKITNVVMKLDGWWEGTLNSKRGLFPDNFVKRISKDNDLKPNSAENSENKQVQLRKSPNRRLKALFSYSPEHDDELKLEVGDVLEYITEVEEGWWKGKLNGKIGIFPSNFVKMISTTTAENSESTPDKNEPYKNSHTTNNIKEEIPNVRTDLQSNNIDKIDNKESEKSANKTKGFPDVIPEPTNQPTGAAAEIPAPKLPPKPVREIAKCFYPYVALNEDELTLNEGDIVTIISKKCEDEGWWRGEFKGKTGLFPDNFVKIISSNNIDGTSDGSNSNTPRKDPTVDKLSPQERNINLIAKEEVTEQVDGVSHSKEKVKKEKAASPQPPNSLQFGNKSFSQIKNIFKQEPTSPVRTLLSPSSNTQGNFSPTTRLDNKKELYSPTKEPEMEDFNMVERGEKLSHITANRAKAPKRRPPSALITRENETIMMNGSAQYPDSMLDTNDNGQRNVLHRLSNGSLGSDSGEKRDSSPGKPTAATSAKKLLPTTAPWMAELKQKQDKKKEIIPTTTNATTNNNENSINSTPEKREPVVKAPPLPAKPTSIPPTSSSPAPPDSNKMSPSLSQGPNNNFTPNSSVSTTPNKYITKKVSPTPPISQNNSHSQSFDGNLITGNNRQYVTIEEYQKLKDRVAFLEEEVDVLRKSLRALLDRDIGPGQIV